MPSRAESFDDPVGVGSELVGHHDHPADVAVDADEHVRLAGAVAAQDGGGGDLVLGDPDRADERAAPDRDRATVDHSLDPLAGFLANMGRGLEREPGLGGGAHERFAEHVRGHAVDRGGEREQLGRLVVAIGDEVAYVGRSDGERAGLVEQHGARFAERLDRAGTLDDDAVAGGAREPGDERDRRGEDQRARRGDHDDGQRADRVAADRPGQAGDDQRRGEEEPGVAVGHPHERRPVRLRLLDQAHERRVGALGRGLVGAHVKRGTGVRRPTQDRHPRPDRHRQRLAAQRARVNHRLRADHRAVDRHNLPSPHDDDVARLHLGHGHLLDLLTDPQLRDLRSALDQRRQLAAGASRGDVLERRSPGEHQADDDSRELLPQSQRSDHRHQGDRVDPHVMVDDHRAHHLDRKLGRQQRHRSRPHSLTGSLLPGQIQRATDDDRAGRDPRQEPIAMLDQPTESAVNPGSASWPASHCRRSRRCLSRIHVPSISAHASARIRTRADSVAVEPRRVPRALGPAANC